MIEKKKFIFVYVGRLVCIFVFVIFLDYSIRTFPYRLEWLSRMEVQFMADFGLFRRLYLDID